MAATVQYKRGSIALNADAWVLECLGDERGCGIVASHAADGSSASGAPSQHSSASAGRAHATQTRCTHGPVR
jgi:hypothetical protein